MAGVKILNHFGKTLSAIRKSRMMSQKELAEKAGIDPSYLNKIEKGLRKPSDDVLFRLADVLVSDELFLAAGKIIPPEFEKKYPKPKYLIEQENTIKDLPPLLKNLFLDYEAKAEENIKEKKKLEDKIRENERACYDLIESINDHKNEKKIKENFYRMLIGFLQDSIDGLWELEDLSQSTGISIGCRSMIIKIWSILKKEIEHNLETFLVDFIGLNSQDAEFISDIIQMRKKKYSEER